MKKLILISILISMVFLMGKEITLFMLWKYYLNNKANKVKSEKSIIYLE